MNTISFEVAPIRVMGYGLRSRFRTPFSRLKEEATVFKNPCRQSRRTQSSARFDIYSALLYSHESRTVTEPLSDTCRCWRTGIATIVEPTSDNEYFAFAASWWCFSRSTSQTSSSAVSRSVQSRVSPTGSGTVFLIRGRHACTTV